MKKIHLYIILAIFFANCKSVNKDTEKVKFLEGELLLSFEKIANLKENLDLVGTIRSFDILDENHFVISTGEPPCIFIYNMNGRQVKKVGNIGRGQYEYLM